MYLHLQRVLYLRPGWPIRNLKILFAVLVARPTPVVGCCGKAHRKTALKCLPFINQPGIGAGVAVEVGETGVTGMEFSDWVGQLDALTLLPV